MSTTGLDVFDRTVQETNVLLKDVGKELHWEDRKEVYHALRTVLHVLRDRLPVGETANLAAQLPILVKGVMFDGWKASPPLKIRKRQEFLDLVEEGLDWVKPEADPERVVRAVFAVLSRRISEGEIEKVREALPEDLRGLWSKPVEAEA